MEIAKLLLILKRRKWLLIQSTLFFLIFSIILSKLVSPAYETTAKIIIEESNAATSLLSEIGLKELVSSFTGATESSDVTNKIALAKVLTNLQTLIEKLQLRDDDGNLIKPQSLLEDSLLSNIFPKRRIEVSQFESTDLLMIKARSLDPEEAKMMADTLADIFINESKKRLREEAQSAKEFINNRIEIVRDEFYNALQNLTRYQINENIIDLNVEAKAAIEKLTSLLTQKEENEYEIFKKKEELNRVRKELEKEGVYTVSTVALTENPQIKDLAKKISDMNLQLAKLQLELTPDHPDIRNLQKEIKSTENELGRIIGVHKETSPDIFKLEIELAGLMEKKRVIEQDIIKYKEQFEGFPLKEMGYAKLKLASDASQTIYTSLIDYLYQIGIVEAMTLSNIKFVDPAPIPDKPVSPKIVINSIFGTLLGVLFGIALIFLFEYIDENIKNWEDVANEWDIPQLGVIPKYTKFKDYKHLLISNISPKNPFYEAFRSIKNNIFYSSPDKPVGFILVTSSKPGEGKSTVSVNLAISIASEGKKVLLLDTDFRRPYQHKFFDLENRKGITSLLVGEGNLSDVIIQTGIPNLDLITSGPIPPNPGNLIDSIKMRQFITEVKKFYNVIVMDSPPILVVNDAIILGRYSDGVVLVIESLGVERRALRDSKKRLESAHTKVFGAILNKVDYSMIGYGYYYKYYDRYYGVERVKKRISSSG